MFIGSPNGCIWRTSNGGTTWTPLTNNQGSLSIASLGLDPTDPTEAHSTYQGQSGQVSLMAVAV
jgi:hypothetical protein